MTLFDTQLDCYWHGCYREDGIDTDCSCLQGFVPTLILCSITANWDWYRQTMLSTMLWERPLVQLAFLFITKAIKHIKTAGVIN